MGKRRRKTKPREILPASRAQRLTSSLEALEIARGHDGLFRGEPEPVLVIGVFVDDQLAGRSRVPFQEVGKTPQTLLPAAPHRLAVVVPPTCARVSLLLAALEEDDGRAVENMYSALERPLRAWRPADLAPEPHELGAAAWPLGSVEVVELQLEGVDWREHLRGDDVVAAGLLVLPKELLRQVVRVPLRSPDGKNEWTAQLAVRIE